MKRFLKTTLSALIIALVSTLTMSVYAYSGTMDANDNIKIRDSISNGKGIVEVSGDAAAGYRLYYQWVEINSNTYKEIKKVNDEMEVISYYNLYEGYTAAGLQDKANEFGQKYENALKAYKAAYGIGIEDFSNAHYAQLKASKINLLPNFDETKWTQTTDNTFSKDLSTFSGKKDYVAWIKLETKSGTVAYDAQAFELIGTKQTSSDNTNTDNNNNNQNNNNNNNNTNTDNNNQNNNNNNQNNNNNNNNNTNTDNNNQNNNNNNQNNNNSANTDNNNQNNNNTNTDNNNQNNSSNTNKDTNNNNTNTDNKNDGTNKNSTQKDTTTSSKLPKTGVSYWTILPICGAMGLAVVEFVKYKKIK